MEQYPDIDEWNNPDWEAGGRIHNWRRYAGQDLRLVWNTFSLDQKQAIYKTLDEVAGNEHWD
ncbi:RecX-like filament modulator [Pseudomonas phage PhiPA3]|uniref:Putative RecX protein n=1 Tax=Pseudomonas phage PhiPA3 TaxID=998086 RepID=F8SJ86_BPPA3|nr:RecX-like filament modulator [Pseudomonas phage PhiPA3]AEH03666.1 putative RecX protein [Pseudomonas phage PhiPA3]